MRLVISGNAQTVEILLVHLLYLLSQSSSQWVRVCIHNVDFDHGMTVCTSVSKSDDLHSLIYAQYDG